MDIRGSRGNTPGSASGIIIRVPMKTLPFEKLVNFENMVFAKGELLKLVFDLRDLPMEDDDNYLVIRWFENKQVDNVQAVIVLVEAMLDLARASHRIYPTPMITDNPKYSFRMFLYQLGLKGNEYKWLRKELLKNLEGSSDRRYPRKDPRQKKERKPKNKVYTIK